MDVHEDVAVHQGSRPADLLHHPVLGVGGGALRALEHTQQVFSKVFRENGHRVQEMVAKDNTGKFWL